MVPNHEKNAQAALRDAEALGYQHPWPMIMLLAKAVVLALLAVAAAGRDVTVTFDHGNH